MENNQNNVEAHLTLAKLYFFQEDYQKALHSLDMILRAAENRGVKKTVLLKATIYCTLSLHYLEMDEDCQAFVNYIKRTSNIEEIRNLVKEEGLEQHWEIIQKRLSPV